MIKWIIIVIIGLIVLGYFGFDIKKAIEEPTTQSNLNYAQRIVSNVWHNYLKKPATHVWNFVKKYAWDVFIDILEKMKNNEPTVLDKASPQVTQATSTGP